jgi:hypothetical protein
MQNIFILNELSHLITTLGRQTPHIIILIIMKTEMY